MTQKTNATFPSENPANLQGLDGLLEMFRKRLFISFRVALPAVVQSYNRTINRVSVVPAITSEDSNGQALILPELSDIPVCAPGGGGFAASFPLQAGDTGWLLFCDRDISLFKASRLISPANTNRTHNLADAVFFPDVMDQMTVVEADAGSAVWQKMDGSVKVVLGTAGVNVTGNVDITGDLDVSGNITCKNVTASGDVQAGGISLKTHVHGGVQGGSGTTGVPQ